MLSDTESFVGRYGDGRSAASRHVEVFVGPQGLEIIEADGSGRRIWAYDALASGSPIAKHAPDVLVTFFPVPDAAADPSPTTEAGATLFIADPRFVAQLTLRAPHLTAGRSRWRYAIPGLIGSAAILAAALIIWLADLSPSRTIAMVVPQAVWTSTGESVFQNLTQGKAICATDAGRQALDRIMTKLSTAAGTDAPFDVRVIDWSLLNAFALPGRRIILTRALLEAVGSAEELAGVVAHEMGHGLELHPEASVVRVLGLSAGLKILLSGGGDTIANVGLLLAQLRYTRDAERSADAHAVAILRRANISAQALAMFFQKLKNLDGGVKSSGVLGAEILRTHPSIAERVDTIAKIPSYPTEPLLTDAQFQSLKGICRK